MRRFRRVWRLILEDVAVKTTDISQEQKLTFLEILKEKNRLARVSGTRGYWEVL